MWTTDRETEAYMISDSPSKEQKTERDETER